MFSDQEYLWLATHCVKIENILQKETFIPMKCCPELTKLLQHYLLIVQPVKGEMVALVQTPKHYHIYKEHLWTKAGAAMTPEMMYKIIHKFSENYIGASFGSQEYCQIAVEIGQIFIGSEYKKDMEDLDKINVLAMQAGHTASIEQSNYASEVGMHQCMSSDLLLQYGRISDAWWEVAGFKPNTPAMLPLHVRQGLRRQEQAQEAGQLPAAAPGSMLAPVFDIQAIVGPLVAAVNAQMQWIEVNLQENIRKAIAKGLGRDPVWQYGTTSRTHERYKTTTRTHNRYPTTTKTYGR